MTRGGAQSRSSGSIAERASAGVGSLDHGLRIPLQSRLCGLRARLSFRSSHRIDAPHEPRSFDAGDYLHVRGKTQIFQGSLQIILTHIDVLDPSRVEAEEYLPQSTQNATKLMARLREVLEKNPHKEVRAQACLALARFLSNRSLRLDIVLEQPARARESK